VGFDTIFSVAETVAKIQHSSTTKVLVFKFVQNGDLLYNKHMTAKQTNFCIVACVLTVFGIVGTSIVNDVFGTYEVVGEPYTVSYSYCGRWTGAGGQSHCADWKVGHERRVNTKVHGLFFDKDSYKVVN